MRYSTSVVGALLLGCASADPTWPSATDEVEEIMYQMDGYRGRFFGGNVIPCTNEVNGPGRNTAAEWLRTGFHDMATTIIPDSTRLGGLDASIQFELGRFNSNNAGPGFKAALMFMQSYFTSRSSMADLIALGVYYSVRSCGGPVIPVRGGRIDATEASSNIGGVPVPQSQVPTFQDQFRRMGFNQSEMIQLIACGHTIGNVHAAQNPLIVPTGTAPNDAAPMDSSDAAFDNRIVTDYLSGTTQNPLVVGPSVARGYNSDGRVFSVDNNATISAMRDSAAFDATCKAVLQKLIEVVPSAVTLTEPIQPYLVKPVHMGLQLNSGGTILTLSGFIRVWTNALNGDSVFSVTLTYKNRNGVSSCGAGGCSSVSKASVGTTSTFDETFIWFPINQTIPVSTGISSFTLQLNMASGSTRNFDNNGASYPMQDEIFAQRPQSCLGSSASALTVVAAVRNDRKDLPVNLVVSYKVPSDDATNPVPTLQNTTVAMTKGDCVGSYTFYTGELTNSGDLSTATFDAVSGSGSTVLGDQFIRAGELSDTCQVFVDPPAVTDCWDGQSSSTTSSTSSSASTTTSSSSSTTSTPSTTSPTVTGTVNTAAVPTTPTAKDTVSPYVSLGCYLDVPSRVLTAVDYTNDAMTLEMCATKCAGYVYFGVEYSRECYCGNALDPRSTATPSSNCNMLCAGDKSEACGSNWLLNLYQLAGAPSPTITHTATVSPYTYVGCWTDSTNARALDAKSFSSSTTMTPQACAAFCSAYHYFGVEYGGECYCADAPSPQSSSAPLVDCNMPCTGDAQQYCGSSNRLDLYYAGTTDGPTQPSAVGGYGWFGCQTEATQGRALALKSYASDNMTLTSCASFCQGYTFFGIEYARECYCGNKLEAGSVAVDAGQCNMVCEGDGKLYCGAGNRLSTYKMGPIST